MRHDLRLKVVKMVSYGMTRCECGITTYLLNYWSQAINYPLNRLWRCMFTKYRCVKQKKQSNGIPVALVLCFLCILSIHQAN